MKSEVQLLGLVVIAGIALICSIFIAIVASVVFAPNVNYKQEIDGFWVLLNEPNRRNSQHVQAAEYRPATGSPARADSEAGRPAGVAE
jgi:hypothetical protein